MQRNVLDYLDCSASSFPNKVCYTDDFEEITFSEFRNKCMNLGARLSSLVSEINSPIVVLVDRTVQSLIGFFGVLYSGNYYVPIDNKMPLKRMELVIKRVNPKAILYCNSDSEVINNFKDFLCVKIDEQINDNIEDITALNFRRNRILDVDPAYVIFTSGSTGEPKGIVVSHRSVIDFVDWMANACSITSENVMGNQAPFYFDLSVKDIYLTLKCGATTHIMSKKVLSFPTLIIDFLNEKKVNTIIWATSAFNLIANSNVLEKKVPEFLNKAILGGEALLASKLNAWKRALPKATIINLYGPTEVTVDCTYYIIDKCFADGDAIPIGKPCENKEVLILDEKLNSVPVGEVGEICVRGSGLAKGYFGDFNKTNEVFIQNPLNKNYPDIIYRTGDLGRIKDDGLIYFEARKDGQIKHFGYRIELGEIERALNSFDKIKAAVCTYDKGTDRIVCFYEGDVGDAEIVSFIKDIVPKYMFPNKFIKLDAMPYNPNGKIDRVALKNLVL